MQQAISLLNKSLASDVKPHVHVTLCPLSRQNSQKLVKCCFQMCKRHKPKGSKITFTVLDHHNLHLWLFGYLVFTCTPTGIQCTFFTQNVTTEVPLLIFSKLILIEDPLTEKVVKPTEQTFPMGLFQHPSGFAVVQRLNPSSHIQHWESLHPSEAYLSKFLQLCTRCTWLTCPS